MTELDPAVVAEVQGFFAGEPLGPAVLVRVRSMLAGIPDVEIRVSKSQVALRRRRGFAHLWRPGQYLRAATLPVVLSIGLGRHDDSARFKEVVHPSPGVWVHHLEVRSLDELDGEVEGWLREAALTRG